MIVTLLPRAFASRPWSVAVLLGAAGMLAASRPVPAAEPHEASSRYRRGVVVSDSSVASRVGGRILERGGNAVDAAIATAFALAVVHPQAGNIGGGGFLVTAAAGGETASFDFRETAPARATREMFLDPGGTYRPEWHHAGHLSAGVPGTVAGLELAHRRLGSVPWSELVEPAVSLAREGFVVGPDLAGALEAALPELRKYPATLAQFTREGRPYRAGEVLVQGDLADTLARIRDEGSDGFYRGTTADRIVREMERGGGLIRDEDLTSYRALEREPVRGTYRRYEIVSVPPPSSGGVALIEGLNILEGYDLRGLAPRSARKVHLVAEALRRAFADRARHLGDPRFVEVPVGRLTSKDYARELRRTIAPRRASPSSPARFRWPRVGSETTHVSVVDRDGRAASLTTTLERSFGSGIVVPGAGFLLNNEMGDFNPVPGKTTPDGRIGTPPNLVAPGKRMLSSMSPTVLTRDGTPRLVLGSPGGRTIISTVLQLVVNTVDHGLAIQDAVDAPRFHHQWLPDELVVEDGCLSPDTRRTLASWGHRVRTREGAQGSAMCIRVGDDGAAEPGVDRRRSSGGAAGP